MCKATSCPLSFVGHLHHIQWKQFIFAQFLVIGLTFGQAKEKYMVAFHLVDGFVVFYCLQIAQGFRGDEDADRTNFKPMFEQ